MAITLDIHEQPRLPLHRQVEICADGIHHRLFRSMITLSVVVLAIAFLMNVLTESMLASSLKRGVFELSAEMRQFSRFTGFFQGPIDPEGLHERVLEAEAGGWRASILTVWLELDEQDMAVLHETAQAAETHLGWFNNLNMAHRRLLVSGREDAEVMRWLGEPEGRREFEAALADIPTLSMPEGFLEFIAEYPAFQQRMQAMTDQFNQQLARLQAVEGEQGLSRRFFAAAQGPEQRQALTAFLEAQQIELPEDELNQLIEQSAEVRLHQQLMGALEHPSIGDAWRDTFDQILVPGEALAPLAGNAATRTWLASQLADSAAVSLSAEQIGTAAEQMLGMREITNLEDRLVADYGEAEGMGTNVFWLIIVSFLVCIVGIANAMLVSVLERFREIATMKCLGALDGFIAVLFLLEAAFLGLVGGAIGVLLGLVIGLGRMVLGYGGWVFSFFSWSDLLIAAGGSVLAGLALATLAAIYPAWMASRMPPMEAMRLE